MRLQRRLAALETKSSAYAPHVVIWGKGQVFADALASSPVHTAATSRLLIELAFVGDDAFTPEQMEEQAKAYAWVDGLQAV